MVFWVFELGVRQKRIEDAEVGMAEGGRAEGQVEEVADHDIDENTEVVCVKVFVCGWGGKEEVQELKDQELKRSLTLTVEKEDYVLAECLEGVAMRGESVYHLVR